MNGDPDSWNLTKEKECREKYNDWNGIYNKVVIEFSILNFFKINKKTL